MKSVVALLALVAPASALVAHAPVMRSMRTAQVAPLAANPQMMSLGGAGRSISRVVRRSCSSVKFPNFGKGSGAGGMGRGCDGGDGGAGTGDSTASSDDDGEEGGLAKVWQAYEKQLEEKPLLVKALTSMVGFFLGDVLAQVFIQKTDPFDWARLFRLASFGFLVHGTTSHWFYGILDGKLPGTSAKVVFSKVFIDQVLWNPIFGVMFFSYVALLEAKGIAYVVNKTKNELLTAVTGSWKVWPAAHAINFRFIPSSQRVLYINSIQIGYNCFLSLISNKEKEY